MGAETTFSVAYLHSAQPTRVHFSCQRVVIAVTSQINGLLNAFINTYLKFKEKKNPNNYMLIGKLLIWGENATPPLWKWSKAFSWCSGAKEVRRCLLMSRVDGGAAGILPLRLWLRSCTRWHPWGWSHTESQQLGISGGLAGRAAASRVLLGPAPRVVGGRHLFGCVTFCLSRLTWFWFYPHGCSRRVCICI